MTAALFEPAGPAFRPGPHCRGPWDPGLLHGGAVGALLAEALQDVLVGYQPARLVINLLRPAPMDDLVVDTRVVRTGARLGLAEALVTAAGKLVTTASLLGIAPADLGGPPQESGPPPDSPEEAENRWGHSGDEEAFIGGGLAFRFAVQSDPASAGAAWFRLVRPVLAGREPSPLARVAAAADVPSAVAVFDGVRFDGVGFINADISFHLYRLPQGEWVRLTATSRWEPNGLGTVSAAVWDTTGRVGTAGQALVLASGLTPA
jgi:hypothetical protein